ncbi:DUF3267 domain-containing protein [Leptogranulimonas caecicola]|uniref:Zincin peptidase n=1 Tax=Leptogranulimonas caecicola TaxID=2894156 RepID=A0AAU9D4R7_9ACTN|nr:DUF3267 domain-containing protein [Leptogranulimonas caecicola]BCV19025.1 hypothetical protein ATOBIA_N13150 [Atopobiaceae bacterium P1]BDC91419.1 hypothetical protein ATTO_12910 [Leptogranulimonas caecicola]
MKDESMITVDSFRLVDDAATLEAMVANSGFILGAGLALTILWLALTILWLAHGWAHAPLSWAWAAIALAIGLISLAALPVHELFHGLAFKLLGAGDATLRFGYLSLGMLYTSCEGAVFSRQRYMAVLLMPAVCVTAILMAVGIWLGYPLAAFICAYLHLAGCTGDFAMARYLLKTPAPYVRDTAYGIDLVEPASEPATSGPTLPTMSGADAL